MAKQQVDIDQLKDRYPPDQVAERYGLELRKAGARIVTHCPFHDERSPSFTVYADHFYCYGCQWRGDVLDFVAAMEGGITLPEAIGVLTGEAPAERSTSTRQSVPRDTRAALEPVIPVPPSAPPIKAGERTPPIYNANKGHQVSWKPPAAVYPYYTDKGELLGYVMRVELGEGEKITPQVTWCRWEGGEGWALRTFPQPRPLYWPEARDESAQNRPVLLVEGEKAADAASRLLGGLYEAATWPGGGHGIDAVDWEPLRGRGVLLWPDADEPGYRAMGKIGAILEQMEAGGEVRLVLTMQDPAPKKGWDLADAKGGEKEALEWAKPRARSWQEAGTLLQLPSDSPVPPCDRQEAEQRAGESVDEPPGDGKKKTPDELLSELRDVVLDNPYFEVLGMNHGRYYVLPYSEDRSGQVERYTATALPKQAVMSQFAPTHWWRKHFPSGEQGVSWNRAVEVLMLACNHRGIYEETNERGRGAWLEGDTAVFHFGSTIWRGGEICRPGVWYKSQWVYPRLADLHIDLGEPLEDKQAKIVSDMIQQLAWERRIYGLMMVGWTVLAPVCGMLDWRPHVWITGPSGSGKTTAINLVERLLGGCTLRAANITTEPALRQTLGSDARPILYDEAEAEDKRSSDRLRNVLDFVRVASSGDVIRKGGSDGVAKEYVVRAMFCLAAINPSLVHWADLSRTSKLVLVKEGVAAEEFYRDFIRKVAETFTPKFASQMLGRTMQHLSVLRRNISTFRDAATAVMRDRRVGDQIGTLLAGAVFCERAGLVSFEDAESFIQGLDYADAAEETAETDEDRLLQMILSWRIRVETMLRGSVYLLVGELAEIVATQHAVAGCVPEEAELALRRVGIKVDKKTRTWLVVANRSDSLQKHLGGTPWARGWARLLRGLEGAHKSDNAESFAGGVKQRGTWIPQQHWLRPRVREEEEHDGQAEQESEV